VALGGLRFPPGGDETHFWYNAVELFGRAPWPSLAALHSYPELSTPLPFVVWGALEYWLRQGVWLPRLLNVALSLSVASLVAMPPGGPTRRSIAACAGLLLCPYYLFVSARIYTDMPAIVCTTFGLWAYLERRHLRSALLFVLAIASRQYAVAFPLAIMAYEVTRGHGRSRTALLAATLAATSLLGWVLFFGAIAPPEALASQSVPTAPLAALIPQNALYLLACTGLYFTLPHALLIGRPAPGPHLRSARTLTAIALIVLLFVLVPPLGNRGVDTITMGLFDRALHAASLAPAARAAVLCVCAAAALVSVLEAPVPLSLVVANALVMLKGHEAWDKYALPLLAALWLLTSRESPR